jgi:adenosylhomocysteine nucleosidase
MKVAIIGAMETEVVRLKGLMQDTRSTSFAGLDFIEGTLAGVNAVVVRSGEGKVNAARCTQALCDHFAPDAIINTGIAGSLRKDLHICDVVVSSDLVQHDMDVRGFGYAIGEIPQLGMTYFEADGQLVQASLDAARALGMKACVGRVASGDQFIDDETRKQFIIDNFDASCCEMEGAAIAQVAWLNKVPFVVVRAISDNADDATVEDQFEDVAADISAHLVERMLQHLAD